MSFAVSELLQLLDDQKELFEKLQKTVSNNAKRFHSSRCKESEDSPCSDAFLVLFMQCFSIRMDEDNKELAHELIRRFLLSERNSAVNIYEVVKEEKENPGGFYL